MFAKRLPHNPIISPETPGFGSAEAVANINGPSLIRVPEWLPNPLGKYYLYFAHHHGDHIRLAYADSLDGPWRIHTPGVLHLGDSRFTNHIASPDAHVDHDAKQIRLYYHGVLTPEDREQVEPEIDEVMFYTQRSRLALSGDGLHFAERSEVLASAYFRVFAFKGAYYGITMPGLLYRSADGLSDFERGPLLLGDDAKRDLYFGPKAGMAVRHIAVEVVDDDALRVYFSRMRDEPERILVSTVDARGDWSGWKVGEPETVLAPEEPYEGADLPLLRSERGSSLERVHQLRDPGIFTEDGRTYLLYTVAGEMGIAIAELFDD